jgi:LacI family transcriptional regulator
MGDRVDVDQRTGARPSATLRDVARESGVSVTTVSRILNKRGSPVAIREETRRRVEEAAVRLGYRPNRLVQGVIHGTSMTIGVVVELGPYYRQVVIGIHDTLSAKGYLPVLGCSKISVDRGAAHGEREIFNALLDHRVDGIIFRPVNEDTTGEYFQEAHDRGVPLVAIDRELSNIDIDLVTSDDAAGGALVAEHLLGLNHRVMAAASNLQDVSSYRNRGESFRACVRVAGGIVRSVDFASVDELCSVMSSGRKRPTAFFAVDDRQLKNVYRAAHVSGMRIPGDVSVVGYGNLAEGNALMPEATTIDQNPGAVGARAAQLMIERIAEPGRPVERAVMPVKLLGRGSTAACDAR